MPILQTFRTYDENSRLSSRHEKHISAKQYTKTNLARDVKNRIKNGRFPLVFSTFQLCIFQNCQVGNSRGLATKQRTAFQTRTTKDSPTFCGTRSARRDIPEGLIQHFETEGQRP